MLMIDDCLVLLLGNGLVSAWRCLPALIPVSPVLVTWTVRLCVCANN